MTMALMWGFWVKYETHYISFELSLEIFENVKWKSWGKTRILKKKYPPLQQHLHRPLANLNIQENSKKDSLCSISNSEKL
jgi:hypothetical protein